MNILATRISLSANEVGQTSPFGTYKLYLIKHMNQQSSATCRTVDMSQRAYDAAQHLGSDVAADEVGVIA